MDNYLSERERENDFTVFLGVIVLRCTVGFHCTDCSTVLLFIVKFLANYCFVDYFTAMHCCVKILLKHFM